MILLVAAFSCSIAAVQLFRFAAATDFSRKGAAIAVVLSCKCHGRNGGWCSTNHIAQAALLGLRRAGSCRGWWRESL